MQKISSFLLAILLMVMSLPALAQESVGPYTLLLKNGNLPVQKNIEAVKSGRLQPVAQDVFDGRAYYVLQFEAIPTPGERDAIEATGIRLMD